ncbi:MAG TPA: Gfo/Idh/MocA family oxidoreductase [Kiritimatiellia bacterium]|nr:Gfo/Idh/MocA family oxidoreductase [Kiritimatiellia bacterium]HPK37964.1 Gfo/Idh/MocA family oxidoreductase [Kiritimatiellia bacterium]
MTTVSRRRFVAASSLAAFGFRIVPRHVLGAPGQPPPSERLNLGLIGIGGMGKSHAGIFSTIPSVRIAALCDVDMTRATDVLKQYPDLPFHKDYRVMLEKEKGLDAVAIATPDHTHAPISLLAMKLGKHVYCQKPMAHTIEEARLMANVAAETKTVTQMGNQGHAGEGLRLTKEWLDAGVIGAVKEIHVWTDRPIMNMGAKAVRVWYSNGQRRPTATPPVPASLDWNLWLGPAPEHAYHPDYVPQVWRPWFDYGNNAIGDMMVHNADPAWYALDLGAPDAVEALTSEKNPDSFPVWNVVTWEFGANAKRGPIKLTWYDGGKTPPPPPGMEPDRKLDHNGIYFVGEKGVILCGGWAGAPRLVPESAMKTFERPPKTIPRNRGGHYGEWVAASIAGRPQDAQAGFWWSGPYMESLLVGTLAIRLNKRIEWDGAAMRAKNAPEADPLIRKAYRKGFELPV